MHSILQFLGAIAAALLQLYRVDEKMLLNEKLARA
jgi:hypothetical protein